MNAALDLNLLKLLVVLGRTRSVSATAREIGLSQPATSSALARLRLALGDALFVRSGTGMAPTPRAERLLPVIEAQLAALSAALLEVADFVPARSAARLHVSLSDLGELVFLPALARRLAERAPGMKLANKAVPARDLASSLEQGHVHVAIGILDASGHGLLARRLFTERYLLIGPDLSLAPAGDLAGLRRRRIVLAAPETTYSAMLEERLERLDLAGNVVLRIRHFGGLTRILGETGAVAIVPGRYAVTIAEAEGMRVGPAPLELAPYDVTLVWHRITDGDPACRWLRDQILDLFQAPA